MPKPRSQYRNRKSPVDRFWLRVDRTPYCWNWIGVKSNGYGQFNVSTYPTKIVKAHRYCYELLVGPIPEGMDLDHTCRNRACVNPHHLEPVTRSENLKRGIAARSPEGLCPRGHKKIPVPTHWKPGRGTTYCRICFLRTQKEQYMKRKEASYYGKRDR